MKKSLLSLAAVAVALGVNAQTESAFLDAEALGLTKDKASCVDMFKLAESDNVTMYVAYGDPVCSTDVKVKPYTTLVVDGVEYPVTTGITGDSNPKVDLTNPDAPATGFVIRFDVKKDGWLTVPCKLSSNKPYYVWEGLSGEDPSLVAYTFAMSFSSTAYPDVDKLVYELPNDGEGYVDFEAEDFAKYATASSYLWPEQIAIEGYTDDNPAKVGGLGVVIFPVYAEAGSYLFHATGSKVTTDGFVFTEAKPESISIFGDEASQQLIGEGGAGVSNISVDNVYNENAPVYNVMGQRVAKDTKGILIQNGRKFINK
jgi:hypothetical protein